MEAVVFVDGLGAIGRRRGKACCCKEVLGDNGEDNNVVADGEEADTGTEWRSVREVWRCDGKEFR